MLIDAMIVDFVDKISKDFLLSCLSQILGERKKGMVFRFEF